MANLFDGIPAQPDAESFADLLAHPAARIERIVSPAMPAGGDWYDQGWDEWVLLIEGAAGVELEGSRELRLERGDHVLIPAGTRHRVSWTDAAAPTIWLAVHLSGGTAD